MKQLSKRDVENQIAASEEALTELGEREFRLWERVRVTPSQWTHNQYSDVGLYWVVAIMGRRCLYFNHVEQGWGWGRFEEWGAVSEYHWQQDEIQHSIWQALFGIDNGGKG